MRTIKILVVLLVFVIHHHANSQIMCTTPPVISPIGLYVSVDPPIFAWHPAHMPGGDCSRYTVHFYSMQVCGGPAYFVNLYDIGQDTIWYYPSMTWYYWSFEEDTLFWTVKTAPGPPMYGMAPCTGLSSLPAALPPVTLINPSNGDSEVVLTPMLDWSRIDSATSYRVRIYNDPLLENITFDSVTVRDSLKVPAGILTGNKTYWWRVKPYNTRGEGPFSDVSRFKTLFMPSPPLPPLLLSPPNNSTGHPLSITLVWNASEGAISYGIQLAYDSLFSSLAYEDPAIIGTWTLVSDLSILTRYYWRVNARNPFGVSQWSQVWNFKTMGTPTQVTLLEPPNNTVNVPISYTFKWSRAYDQTSHLIVSNYWYDKVTDTVSMANLIRDTTLTDTLKAVTGMNNSTAYFWRVRAKNQIGWGNFAPWFRFTTVPGVPPAPVLISPLNGAVGQSLTPKLDWAVTPTAAGYRVQISLDSVFSGTVLDSITNVDSLVVPINRLANNTRYYWRINATNAGGTGPWSSVWHFNTLLIGTSSNISETPKEYKLYVNYPNPFNPSTIIKFDIPKETNVKIVIYDVQGKTIHTLIEGNVKAGKYEIEWDGINYPSGVYFYKLETSEFTQTRKMVLIK